MSMELYYELKEERLHLISVVKDLTAQIKVLSGKLQFMNYQDEMERAQNKINFIHFRRCEAEKRISDINFQCAKIGRKHNKECLAIKKQKKAGGVQS